MKVGLAYDLKDEVALHPEHAEDALEEYDCPETVAAIAKALETLGHSVVRLGGGREFLVNILKNNVDFVVFPFVFQLRLQNFSNKLIFRKFRMLG